MTLLKNGHVKERLRRRWGIKYWKKVSGINELRILVSPKK